MKSVKHSIRQSGFVDLGMSLLVIAIAGGVAYGVENSPSERAAEPQHEYAAEQALQAARAEISASRQIDAGTALE